MSYTNMIHEAGFVGTPEQRDTLRAAIAAALELVDALAEAQPSTSPLHVRARLSTANVSGTAAAPVIDLRWMNCPPDPSAPVGIDVVSEAAVRARVSGATVRHCGAAGHFGPIDVTALAVALGF